MPRIVQILATTLRDPELRALELVSRGQDDCQIVEDQAKTLVDLRAAEYRASQNGGRLVLTRLGARLLFERAAAQAQSFQHNTA